MLVLESGASLSDVQTRFLLHVEKVVLYQVSLQTIYYDVHRHAHGHLQYSVVNGINAVVSDASALCADNTLPRYSEQTENYQ